MNWYFMTLKKYAVFGVGMIPISQTELANYYQGVFNVNNENTFLKQVLYVAGSIGPLFVVGLILNAGISGHGMFSFVIAGIVTIHGYFALISLDNLWFARRTLWNGGYLVSLI